jgi:hypothetical protein
MARDDGNANQLHRNESASVEVTYAAKTSGH